MRSINKIILALGSVVLLSSSIQANEVKTGANLYKKCAACHGVNAEKHALGQSAVLNVMEEEDIVAALSGYQEGTYGRGMKVLMKNQVSALDVEEIKVLSAYIVTLKP